MSLRGSRLGRRAATVVVALAALSLVGCLEPSSPSGLATERMREPLAGLEEIEKAGSQIQNLRSLLAQRDGERVVELYFSGATSSDRAHLRSMTKSVTSLLVGIALDRGDLRSVDQTLSELLGSQMERFGPEKGAIRLGHLLTMTAGLKWDESDVEEFNRLRRSPDPVAHYLERRFVDEPGERWEYSSGAIHLLSVVVSRASGLPTREFAERYLFDPLEIDDFSWESMNDGHANGSAGLELRPRDILKLGELVLDGGEWGGRRIVSKAWIDESTSPRVLIDGGAYGYQWWVPTDEPLPMIFALGFAGQTLVIAPEHRALIAANANWRNLGRPSAEQQLEIQRFVGELAGFVLPDVDLRQ